MEHFVFSTPRNDHIDWDTYFMGIAKLSAMRSKDPNTQVGACIVSTSNRIVSVGYNGMPNFCNDKEFPWNRDGGMSDEAYNKYKFVVHAELNAILNAKRDLSGCSIYVSLFPCNECTKAIIQSGIRKVIYLSDKYRDTMSSIVSKEMMKSAGVDFYQLEIPEEYHKLLIDFDKE